MAVGFKGSVSASLLNALLNATAYTGPVALYAQMHTGDPGAAGTANAVTFTTTSRPQITFSTAAGGSVTNSNSPTFVGAPANATYTHISIWDAVSGGNFLVSGTVSGSAVYTGDSFQLSAGNVTVSLNTAA